MYLKQTENRNLEEMCIRLFGLLFMRAFLFVVHTSQFPFNTSNIRKGRGIRHG